MYPNKGPAASDQQSMLKAVKQSLPSKLPPLDQHTLQKAKEKALLKAKQFQQQVGSSAKESLQNARLAAADITSAKSPADAGRKVWRLVHHATDSKLMKAVSRVLISLYFINMVWDSYGRWSFMQQPDIKLRAERWPQHYAPVSFPWFGVLVLLPCALLAAAGFHVLVVGTVLVIYEAYDSAHLIWSQLTMLLLYGYKPNELVVKRLAIMGCASLVLANSIKESKVINSYAGLLLSGGEKSEPSRRKSLVLLLGRLLMTSLFVYVGVVQFQRVVARDFVLFAHMPHSKLWARDGHDNNWLLLEFLFSLPFAVGYKTGAFARLLALTMALEAVTCWPFWVSWPTWSYAAHVRLHFVTNLAVAGGLLLLANFGAGRYTVDRLLGKKKE